MIDYSEHADLLGELENRPDVRADLAAAPDLAAMRAIVGSGVAEELLPSFDRLAVSFGEALGDRGATERLRTALTAIPHEGGFARALADSRTWVFAAERDAEDDAWQTLGEQESTPSLTDEAADVYTRVISELGEVPPEDQSDIWTDVCARVESQTDDRGPDRAEATARAVLAAYRSAQALEEAELDEAAERLLSVTRNFVADIEASRAR
ncbi:hypothetical protein [Umezawaea sp. Da 62-37]|uniref:hypothetical protein n=1 Tax=Umezawaea sp. Da 62-37 TaxID=3075927 RepID=UPI0028F7340E|nr:hypothetical protein [Umezawaea sp. Da 62-37]WNV88004.1 hypothetical protein RM788_06870 [Umezawaea sp. Da 62-37]